MDWWRLAPRNDLVHTSAVRGAERQIDGRAAPPLQACWCLAEPGAQYVLYVRGTSERVRISLAASTGRYAVRQFDPRSGAWCDLGACEWGAAYVYGPPDEGDWVVVLRAAPPAA